MDDSDMIVAEYTSVDEHQAISVCILGLIRHCLGVGFAGRCVEHLEIHL